MLVRLKRQFIGYGRRFRPKPGGVEIPDGLTLPRDARVWDGKEWVTQEEYTPPKRERKAEVEKQGKLDL